MSSVQTVYIQYTQLKRAVNPPRKKNGGGGSGRAGRRSKKADGVCRPRACGFAAPPGMLILVCRPRSQPRSAARYVCFSPAARALVGSPSCLVNRSVVPVCRPRACGFAAPPGMLILVCRPRSQPRSAARNVCFSPAARAHGFAAPRGCAFGRPWAPISAPRRPVCLFWSAARALAGSPFCKRNGANALPCRPRACGFAAPPDMLISAPPRRRAARESTPARGR